MENKKCFKCGKILPLDSFYKHPKMKDGYLNKCKDCTKNDVSTKYFENIKDENYVEKERIRGREKYKRLNYSNINRIRRKGACSRKFIINNYKNINLENMEIHHWNYNLYNNIFILTRREHKLVHKYLTFDKESQCFINNNELITDKSSHRNLIYKILGRNNVEEYPKLN